MHIATTCKKHGVVKELAMLGADLDETNKVLCASGTDSGCTFFIFHDCINLTGWSDCTDGGRKQRLQGGSRCSVGRRAPG